MKCETENLNIGEQYIFMRFYGPPVAIYFSNFEIVILVEISKDHELFVITNGYYRQGVRRSWLKDKSILLLPYSGNCSLQTAKILYGN